MAVPGQEVELITGGTDLKGAVRGPFVQNMLFRHGTWKVRKGYGTITQRDTTLGLSIEAQTVNKCDPDEVWGYTRHLGSHLLKTDQGHEQILSVFVGKANVGSAEVKNQFQGLFFAVVYDLSTGDQWEEVLHSRTVDYDHVIRELPNQHGVYATNRENDFQRWLVGQFDQPIAFTEFGDLVVFGNRSTGLWQYRPAYFASRRDRARLADRPRQLDSFYDRTNSPGREEAAVITRLHASDGTNVPGIVYLRDSELPPVVDLTTLAINTLPILVVASGRQILFSEASFPGSFPAELFLVVPTESEITAVREHNGQIFIWTSDETWIYQPNLDNFFVNLGRLLRISDTIGCVGPGAVARTDSALAWVDRNGVWVNTGGMGVEKLSEAIDPYFQEQTTTPLTAYYTESGFSDDAPIQPAIAKRFDSRGVNMVWSPDLRTLLISVPEDSGTILAMTEAGWSFWDVESMAVTALGVSVSGTARNIQNAWLLADEERLLAVGGVEVQFVQTTAQGGEDTCPRSFYVLEYDRGGGLDRNVEEEDDRSFVGYYKNNTVPDTDTAFMILGKPIYLGPQYDFPGATETVTRNFFLLPVLFVPARNDPSLEINEVEFHFSFNEDEYRPIVLDAAADELAAVIPPERQGSVLGWGLGAGGAAREARLSGVNEIHLHWNGTVLPPNTWSNQPFMNAIQGRPNPLIFIPFEALAGTAFGMNIGLILFEINGLAVANLPTWWWVEPARDRVTQRVIADARAQPVDWAYASAQFLADEAIQAKVRGYAARVLTHGKGSNKQVDPWLYGLFNSILSADWRGWSSQILDQTPSPGDVAGVQELRDRGMVRFRIKDSGTLKTVTFNNGLVFGSSLVKTPVEDTVLIGDEEVTVFNVSESVKGGHFRYLFFGFVQNKAEVLTLESVKAVVRAVGGRRRIGHVGRSDDVV